MALNPYNRINYKKNNESEKVISNQELIFGFTHKQEFHTKMEDPHNRLTGDRANLSKNKVAIIHSNSTNRIQKLNTKEKIPTNERNVSIINNNLIINNNADNNKNYNSKMNNVFSKLGGDIIKNNNKLINNENNVNLINKIRNKSQVKPVRNNNNIHLINKNNIPSNNKYNSPSSNIQGIIDNLIQATKSKALGLEGNDNSSNNYKPSLFNAGLLLLTKDNQNVNVNKIKCN